MQSLFFPCMKERDKRGSARRVVLIVIAFLFEVKVLVAKSLPKYTGDLLIIYRCISRNGHVTKDIPKYFVLQ